MRTLSGASRLESFAREYIAPFNHHAQVRSEHLAEAVRAAFGLPDFPREVHLRRLCDEVGIDLGALPFAVDGLKGINQQYGATPSILLAEDLHTRLVETTIPHELREVLENTFSAVDSTYVGLNTHDNKVMNPRSDRFAGFLLMPTRPSRALLKAVGYDLLEFSRRTERSLPSVLLRAQQLYSSRSGAGGPVMGAWLFQADWDLVASGPVAGTDIRLCYSTVLSGFSQAKGRPEAELFPRQGHSVVDFRITRLALDEPGVVARRLTIGLFEDDDYFVVAEREVRFGKPWRMLLTAVRIDQISLLQPWLERLGLSTAAPRVTSL
jgi:hypothetical protein